MNVTGRYENPPKKCLLGLYAWPAFIYWAYMPVSSKERSLGRIENPSKEMPLGPIISLGIRIPPSKLSWADNLYIGRIYNPSKESDLTNQRD